MGPGQSGNTTGIWYISIFGETPRKLRDEAGRSSVSPDGRQIAFISGRKEAEIWVMGNDGEEPKRLAEAGADGRFLQVQWSPDGRRVAAMKSSGEGGTQSVSIESLDLPSGATVGMFSSPGLQSFCWTADGRLFLALQEAPPNERETNLWEASVRPDGELASPLKQITKWAGFSFWDLSATTDGKRLAFVKSGSQADVYVAKLDRPEMRLSDIHRLTLNEHDDWPSAWTSEGDVLFYSDRNGRFDIFRQRPGVEQPVEVLSSAEDKLQPELTSDSKWLLYWQSDPKNTQHAKRLMAMKVAGGAVSPLINAKLGTEFHCARSKLFCVFAEADASRNQAVFSRLEIGSPGKTEIARVPKIGSGDLVWTLAPDGSAIALADIQETGTTLRMISLSQNRPREYRLNDIAVTGMASLSTGWLLTSSSLHGNELLYLSDTGYLKTLWKSSSPLSAPVVSTDGRMVAFGLLSQESNAWLLQQK